MTHCDFITFDCYGTLIDWERGIRRAFASAGIDDRAALERYAQIERAVEEEAYRSYRDVLTETAARVGNQLGAAVTRPAFLADSLPSWQPFPDTNPALQRLRAAGIRLGILSNVDDDLLAETRKHFTVDFDLIITAQQVHSYKPRHAHFLAARKRIGGARWLHAAQSNFHDIVPANRLGIESAWINRRAEQPLPGGTPALEFANLAELAEAMVSS
jgi:2-haloalkanoic acid dehalogenase type II